MEWGDPIWPHSKPCHSITMEPIQGYFINSPCILQVVQSLTAHTLTLFQALQQCFMYSRWFVEFDKIINQFFEEKYTHVLLCVYTVSLC